VKKFFLYAFCVILAGGLLARAVPSQATTFQQWSGGGDLLATATFELSGTTLTVTLTNNSTSDVLVPTDVLTGLFFNTTNTLTPVSASLNSSTAWYGTISDAGDGWGYASGVNAQGMNSAISSSGAVSGLGHSNFSSANNALQGLDYGILSAGDNSATGNTGVTGHGPLIQDSVVFTFTVAPGFTLSELGNTVLFQYGTSVNAYPSPEPTTLVLLRSGLVALVAFRKKLKK
jgi:hypothetical protein